LKNSDATFSMGKIAKKAVRSVFLTTWHCIL